MPLPTLAEVVAQHPYPDFQDWWPVGPSFLRLMADAILANWQPLPTDSLATVQARTNEYMSLVYKREARPKLVVDFAQQHNLDRIHSGEFDALSYGFFCTAFEVFATMHSGERLYTARRQFTERVGAHFFSQLAAQLALDLPPQLKTDDEFVQLTNAITQVGEFLYAQSYLRSHFAFRFDVTMTYAGRSINQQAGDFLPTLAAHGTAYALYEMGYPVILPSAVYLYQTVGEAQHHSSRMIEELFARAGCAAKETDDFDPSGYPSEFVVELWEIRRTT